MSRASLTGDPARPTPASVAWPRSPGATGSRLTGQQIHLQGDPPVASGQAAADARLYSRGRARRRAGRQSQQHPMGESDEVNDRRHPGPSGRCGPSHPPRSWTSTPRPAGSPGTPGWRRRAQPGPVRDTVEQLREELRANGQFTYPILIDEKDHSVIHGVRRVCAALLEGHPRLPVATHVDYPRTGSATVSITLADDISDDDRRHDPRGHLPAAAGLR